jgi:hypothetical protein
MNRLSWGWSRGVPVSRPFLVYWVLLPVLAAPHLLSPGTDSFLILRLALSVSRSVLGILEFLAYVISLFMGGPSGVEVFGGIVLLDSGAVLLASRAWQGGFDTRFFILLALVGNLLFSLVAVWAGSVPVIESQDCLIKDSFPVRVWIAEYSEIVWMPDRHYFVAWQSDTSSRWHTIFHSEPPEPVPNACDRFRLIAPNLEELLQNSGAA